MGEENSDIIITLRVPKRIADRIDRVSDKVASERTFALKSRVSRSDVVRYLLLMGLEEMEKEE